MRAANVTVTSQYFVAVHFLKSKADTSNSRKPSIHTDCVFEFGWTYEVLLFNDDPCAWLYIEVAVMAWVTHRWTLGMPIKTFNELRRASKQQSGQT